MRESTVWSTVEQTRLEEALRLDAEANLAFASEVAATTMTILCGIRTRPQTGPDRGARQASDADHPTEPHR